MLLSATGPYFVQAGFRTQLQLDREKTRPIYLTNNHKEGLGSLPTYFLLSQDDVGIKGKLITLRGFPLSE